MMFSTIFLIANLVALIFTGTAIFSFAHFIWMYPVELGAYLVFVLVLILFNFKKMDEEYSPKISGGQMNPWFEKKYNVNRITEY